MNSDSHLFYSEKELRHVICDMMTRTNPTLNKQTLKKMTKKLVQDTPNVYHNIKHTFEVFQVVSVLSAKVPFLTQTDRSLLQIAALCHDFHHPGVSNAAVFASGSFTGKELVYLQKRGHALVDFSLSYNEMMHVYDSMQLIEKYLMKLFPKYVFENIRTIITLILSTDIALHDNYMKRYIQDCTSRIGVMMLILKLADVSHPLRPFHVHLYWVFNHHRENRTDFTSVQDITKDTLWFYNRFVEPMLFSFNKHFGLEIQQYLKNKQEWKLLLAGDVGA